MASFVQATFALATFECRTIWWQELTLLSSVIRLILRFLGINPKVVSVTTYVFTKKFQWVYHAGLSKHTAKKFQ